MGARLLSLVLEESAAGRGIGVDRDSDRVDAAHLAGADADGLAVFGIDDGVGLDVLADFPGEEQGARFLGCGRASGDDFEVGVLQWAVVGVLHEQAAGDVLQDPVARGGLGCRRTNASGATWVYDFDEAKVLLRGELGFGGFVEGRSGTKSGPRPGNSSISRLVTMAKASSGPPIWRLFKLRFAP